MSHMQSKSHSLKYEKIEVGKSAIRFVIQTTQKMV